MNLVAKIFSLFVIFPNMVLAYQLDLQGEDLIVIPEGAKIKSFDSKTVDVTFKKKKITLSRDKTFHKKRILAGDNIWVGFKAWDSALKKYGFAEGSGSFFKNCTTKKKSELKIKGPEPSVMLFAPLICEGMSFPNISDHQSLVCNQKKKTCMPFVSFKLTKALKK